MKKILLITNSYFIKKNFQSYINQKKIKKKLLIKSSRQISKFILKNSKIKKQIEFCIVDFGLSGGIQYNIKNGCIILEKNVEGYLNVLNCLKDAEIRKVYFISASCVYPKNMDILSESDFAKNNIEKTSIHYASSKMLGTLFISYVNRNNKFNWKSIIPATLYGKYNSTDHNNAHVIGAFFNKFKNPNSKINLWGTGKVKREFLHIMDFIDAIFFINKNKFENEIINVGAGTDMSIKALAKIFSEMTSYTGKIMWDKSKPDGAKRKLLNSSYIFSKGWKPKISIKEGISQLLEKSN
jgi:GDP-L-fucose synthase